MRSFSLANCQFIAAILACLTLCNNLRACQQERASPGRQHLLVVVVACFLWLQDISPSKSTRCHEAGRNAAQAPEVVPKKKLRTAQFSNCPLGSKASHSACNNRQTRPTPAATTAADNSNCNERARSAPTTSTDRRNDKWCPLAPVLETTVRTLASTTKSLRT